MPLYGYACYTCGTIFEQRQHFDDAPLQQCPLGHSEIRRVYAPAGVIFRGSGWYITDSRKPPDEDKTYGYQRAGVLSVFVNALTLGALSAWIFYESVGRLRNPETVHEGVMIAVAASAVGTAVSRSHRSELRHQEEVLMSISDRMQQMLGTRVDIGPGVD